MHVLGKSLVQCIKHWQRYISNLQKDLPALKEIMCSLHKVKEEAHKELNKVEGQAEYRLVFISSKHTKLTQLLEKLKDLHCHNNTKETMKVTLVEKELLQRKVDT